MMTLDPHLENLVSRRNAANVFWSAEVPYAGGTFYVANRNKYADGKLFRSTLLSPLPKIETVVAEDDRWLEVKGLSLVVDNTPGRMADGSRFSDHINEEFQGRFVSVYLNAVGGISGVKRQLVYLGVPRGRPKMEEDAVRFELVPLSEHYLPTLVIRVVRPDHYPDAREADIGRGIPWVVSGTVRSVDGIMRKPRQATIPVADGGNAGDAQLGRPNIFPTTVSETWTITAFDPQPTRFTESVALASPGMGNAFDPFFAAGSQLQWHFAFSLKPNAAAEIQGVKFKARSANSESAFLGWYLIVSLSDAGGSLGGHHPGQAFIWRNNVLVQSSETSYVDIFVPIVATIQPDRYWVFEIGWYGPAGIQSRTYLGRHVGLFGPQIELGLASMTEDYDGKFMYAGVPANWTDPNEIADLAAKYPDEQFVPSHILEAGQAGSYSDDADFGGRMIPYEIVYTEEIFNRYVPFFKVEGSASGFQGYGTFDTDFTAENGRIKIPSSIWSGTPAHGDSWTFTTPGGPAEIVFAESRADSPVSSIQNVAINDLPVSESGAVITKLYSYFDGEGLVAMLRTMAEVREEWDVRADVTASGATDAGSVMLRAIRRAGVPDDYIDLTTWDATTATLQGLAWNFAGMVDDAGMDYKALLLDMAFQCRSRFEWPRDKARLRYIPDPGAETVLTTVTESDLFLVSADPHASAKPNHSREQSDGANVVNKVIVRYGRNWSKASGADAYTGIKEAKSDASISRFRERKADPKFVCDFITSAAVAQLLATFELARRNYPDDEHIATVGLPWFKYEPGDAYLVDIP